jgi:hypothetical protein
MRSKGDKVRLGGRFVRQSGAEMMGVPAAAARDRRAFQNNTMLTRASSERPLQTLQPLRSSFQQKSGGGGGGGKRAVGQPQGGQQWPGPHGAYSGGGGGYEDMGGDGGYADGGGFPADDDGGGAPAPQRWLPTQLF